ncbi:MAG: high-affinity iron transporter, partial [Pseudomonadota bacterium]|nr:high-affinity iron transporter [Pseudomonadota bacterium]
MMTFFQRYAHRGLAWCLGLLCALPVWAATDGAAVAADIMARGDAAVQAYDPAHPLPTAATFSALYFDVFEAHGMELDLGVKAPGLKSELEVLFGSVNSQSMRAVPAPQLEHSWQQLRNKLAEAARLYEQPQEQGFIPTLIQSLLILLREGIEAMLVVGALATYLRRAGGADRVWVIHAGVGAAVLLSLLTSWALLGWLQALSASRTVVEGVSLVLASGVLFYVSFWLFSKREAQRWQAWIAQQLDSALSRGSTLALGAAAFLAVYREGAETVLFYHALHAAQPTHTSAIAAGLGAGVVALAGVYVLYRHTAVQLPLRTFFGVTAALLYTMAVVFLGQAIVELQAAGWLYSTALAGIPTVSWLGLAPTT